MRNAVLVLFVGFCLLSLSGCIGVATPVTGWVYTDAKFGNGAENGASTAKTGKACAQTYLTMVVLGDASVEKAKANGGITQVAVVDHSAKNILGIFGEFCTIVRGS